MPETLILTKAVAVATVWENISQKNGQPYWKVVTDAAEKFTAFDRALVAKFIDGKTPQQRNDSQVYNFRPPLQTTIFFEATPAGLVLAKTPEGTPEPAVTQPAAPAGDNKPSGGYGGYRGGGSKGGGWKPEDKRPSLVTMTFSYAKDQVSELIGHSADLGNMDPDLVVKWAEDVTKKLAKSYLAYALDELKALGFDPKEAAK